jgi:flagellar basal body P-ring protein FlgI
VRDNLLIGYGLVVGLDGTGDDLDSSVFTRESLIGMLQRLGVNARNEDLDTDNVAAVMVTANLPAFSRQGSRIDIDVSALGDAESLLGGTSRPRATDRASPRACRPPGVYPMARSSSAKSALSCANSRR